ncbi:sensor histidine kinase [Leucobacter komagatae]|uniref:histidine kinase n=1 Tax=Leucobacter komagatae TaxID=55969 RepID=A0A0D0IJL7_9MICO|nr:HAMP domain-containing sensor histidine kinase [Leucobacter komagatae]KIP51834.1 histidine kinase [Leucobacter komagatae]
MTQLRDFGTHWADVSLRTKITIVTVFILFLGLIVAGVGTFSVLRPILINQQSAELAQIRNNPTNVFAPGTDPERLSADDVFTANPRYYVAFLAPDGSVLFDNSRDRRAATLPDVANYGISLKFAAAREGESVAPIEMSSADGTHWRGVTTLLYVDGVEHQASGTLLIADSTTTINQHVAQYIIVFTGFGIAVILLGAALTRILITTTLLPLAEVEQTALEISRGDFSKRIIVASPHTEVGHLGDSLNVMLDRLDGSLEERERTIERMRRFVGDASHELRTPLVSVRGYAELYRMGALQTPEQVGQAMERIEKEAIRMTSLVEDLLALARLDERRPLQLAKLSLNQLARDAALDARAGAPDREISVVEAPSDPKAFGDENKIRQLITNLIGNAKQHTPEGSPIEIVVTALPQPIDDAAVAAVEQLPVAGSGKRSSGSAPMTGSTGVIRVDPKGMTRFEIVDHGEGIPEQIREKIFGRFWRADSSRNRETGGSGLGLAIVRSIVEAHRGTVTVHETPGGGATFRVDLPAAPRDPEPGADDAEQAPQPADS